MTASGKSPGIAITALVPDGLDGAAHWFSISEVITAVLVGDTGEVSVSRAVLNPDGLDKRNDYNECQIITPASPAFRFPVPLQHLP